MSLLQKKYAHLINPDFLRTHQKPILLATGIAAASAPLLAYACSCYRQWLAIGKGGVPYNVFGWLFQSSLHLVARTDTNVPVPRSFKRVDDVAALYGPAGGKSYLTLTSDSDSDSGSGSGSKLEPRKGAPPVVPGFVAPQRQTSEVASAATVDRQNAFLAALARANPAVFELQTSKLEGPPHKALWLRPEEQARSQQEKEKEKEGEGEEGKRFYVRLGAGSGGEWAHVHGEGSTHVTLSPVDAAAAIEAGWAQRHPLSGFGGGRAVMPWGYVMVYAPRDEEEWGVWRELVLAGARYAAEGAGVEVVVPE
ncbi:hypothetical protein K449DRAFT_386816 [Hypoxylon sp. EC38]|nr:hypothetical protein K449DRAFT_386816 [Hypoxylon sp. EC38]